MKEIGYRAYLKNKKQIVDVLDIYFLQETIGYMNKADTKYAFAKFNDIELLPYTGLKDKNGKEIFEGDIVEVFAERNVYNRKQSVKDKYIKIRGVVEFEKNTFYGYGFNINYQNKYNDKLCEPVGKETCQRTLSHWDLGFYAEKHNYHAMWKFKDEIEVIGNIYDNPELLEVEK